MPLFSSLPISMVGTVHGPTHRGLRCCHRALQNAWRDAITAGRALCRAGRVLMNIGDVMPRRWLAAPGSSLVGGLAVIGLGVVLVLGAPVPARAAHGFSGLDNDTLETLRRSDQRPKHDATGPERDARDKPRHGAPTVSSSQAARIARAREGGKVLNVVLEHGSSGPYYRVKILEHGRVQEVHVDAR